jgi:hypothetical protein
MPLAVLMKLPYVDEFGMLEYLKATRLLLYKRLNVKSRGDTTYESKLCLWKPKAEIAILSI